MPLLAEAARHQKFDYFLNFIPKDARILEIGSADGWLGRRLKEHGFANYLGLDLLPTADIVGDIRNWKELGIKPESFDVIFALEVLEHVVCFKECFELLKPGGLLMVTTPVPYMDWLCIILETIGLNQKRTSPHAHLFYFKDIPFFVPVAYKNVAFFAQWGVFRKPVTSS